jgi:hypothetical protein
MEKITTHDGEKKVKEKPKSKVIMTRNISGTKNKTTQERKEEFIKNMRKEETTKK